jgi:hypothetical protein
MATNGATPQRLYLFQLSNATRATPGGSLELSTGCYLLPRRGPVLLAIDAVPLGSLFTPETAPSYHE